MRTCPLCGEKLANRAAILRLLRELNIALVKSDATTITIHIPKEALVDCPLK